MNKLQKKEPCSPERLEGNNRRYMALDNSVSHEFLSSREKRKDVISNRNDIAMVEQYMYESKDRLQHAYSERSPSPTLRGDLSRISGPRTPSPGPRLPKMKDSRSPSKVPIMRDSRSPIRKNDKYDKCLPGKEENYRLNRGYLDSSPKGQFLTEEDFIGSKYEDFDSQKEEQSRLDMHRRDKIYKQVDSYSDHESLRNDSKRYTQSQGDYADRNHTYEKKKKNINEIGRSSEASGRYDGSVLKASSHDKRSIDQDNISHSYEEEKNMKDSGTRKRQYSGRNEQRSNRFADNSLSPRSKSGSHVNRHDGIDRNEVKSFETQPGSRQKRNGSPYGRLDSALDDHIQYTPTDKRHKTKRSPSPSSKRFYSPEIRRPNSPERPPRELSDRRSLSPRNRRPTSPERKRKSPDGKRVSRRSDSPGVKRQENYERRQPVSPRTDSFVRKSSSPKKLDVRYHSPTADRHDIENRRSPLRRFSRSPSERQLQPKRNKVQQP